MGLLNSIVEWLVAFGAGFFGHVVAHDFCEVTPMISRKIIEAAASRLPASIRERYREEWRADLCDQHGALAKLFWSFGCFICARRLRREDYRDQMRRTSFELRFENGETIAFNRTTFGVFFAALKYRDRYSALLKWAPTSIRLMTLWCAVAIPTLKFRRWGPPDYTPVKKLLQASDETMPSKITILVDGIAVQSAIVRSDGVFDETT